MKKIIGESGTYSTMEWLIVLDRENATHLSHGIVDIYLAMKHKDEWDTAIALCDAGEGKENEKGVHGS